MVRLLNRSFHFLAGKLRRAFGMSDEEEAVEKPKDAQQSGAGMLRRKRVKVALAAILFGLFSALVDMPLPAEDLYRAARAQLRVRPAPQDIAMIAVDDKTLIAYDRNLPSREEDSKLIDALAAAGVTKIVFDRAHADAQNPHLDRVFSQTLAKHQGKVWLGFLPAIEMGFQRTNEILPRSEFMQSSELAAMNGYGSPFGLSVKFPTRVQVRGRTERSISAVLANFQGKDIQYRPDYSIDPRTVPTYSYSDVLANRITRNALRGKSVVVGDAFYESADFYLIPFREGKIPGAYFHIMGAHTLKRGAPLDLTWYPAVLLAALVVAFQPLRQKKSIQLIFITGIALLVAPLVLDEMGVNVDVLSGVAILTIAAFGFRRINAKYLSSDVDAMTTTAISSDFPSEERDVYALKIANLAELSEEWSARDVGDFVNTLIAYVKGPSEIADVAFERDVLVWLAPKMEPHELERHADGLALMLKTAISHDWQSTNGAPALGVDTNYDLPVALRIKKAMQAAEEAVSRGVRFIINDATHLEARNQRLELFRVLEKGLRDRNIGVGYQPKVDLASGRIVGAETLIRWQPDGRAFINPQELVLAAEVGDRINELTLLVMETALVEAKHAIAIDPRFKLAVNMSAKSLSDTHLLFDIMTLLGRFDFPPENLTLELTETAKLEDHRIAPQIAALKARGIGLSIDDFGTGQSNLEYIEKLPSSELKIDKRFVQNMAASEESRAVVRATIEIAHSLGKTVVAEGVEDVAVAATLRAMGCDQAQGYLFSQAIAMTELLAMMGGRRAALKS